MVYLPPPPPIPGSLPPDTVASNPVSMYVALVIMILIAAFVVWLIVKAGIKSINRNYK